MSTDAAASRLFSALGRLEERVRVRIETLEQEVRRLRAERDSLLAERSGDASALPASPPPGAHDLFTAASDRDLATELDLLQQEHAILIEKHQTLKGAGNAALQQIDLMIALLEPQDPA
jgi:hypothetical protein